jgi:OmpA-OmpF porin, OOP family
VTARLLLALALAAAPLAALAADVDGLKNVHFGSNSASLTSLGYERLRAAAEALKADPQLRLEIGGYADASGDAAANLRLSGERAKAARDFLVGLGVDRGRLAVKAYGDSDPLNDNATLERRSYNRRVHFRRLETP